MLLTNICVRVFRGTTLATGRKGQPRLMKYMRIGNVIKSHKVCKCKIVHIDLLITLSRFRFNYSWYFLAVRDWMWTVYPLIIPLCDRSIDASYDFSTLVSDLPTAWEFSTNHFLHRSVIFPKVDIGDKMTWGVKSWDVLTNPKVECFYPEIENAIQSAEGSK